MNNQTIKNDENNRGEKNKKDLENEIRSTWLRQRDSNFTSEETQILLDCFNRSCNRLHGTDYIRALMSVIASRSSAAFSNSRLALASSI